MPAFPAKAKISAPYPNPSNAVAREGFGEFYDATTGLLGTTGLPADARAALGVGSTLSFRNRLINGNFTINQRVKVGSVVLAAGVYGHDRWKAGAAGCTYTFSTSGNDVLINITAGSLVQTIEAANIEGGMYVLTWTGTAQGKVVGGVYAPSGGTYGPLTANTSPSVEFGVGTLTNAQLEPGVAPTPYERRPIGIELQLCQRYYEAGSATHYGYGVAGVSNGYRYPFKVAKRATPSMFYAATINTNVSTFDAINPTVADFFWRSTTTANGGFIWDGTWVAVAEL